MTKKWDDGLLERIDKFFDEVSDEQLDTILEKTNFDFYNKIGFEVIPRKYKLSVQEHFVLSGNHATSFFIESHGGASNMTFGEIDPADRDVRYALAA